MDSASNLVKWSWFLMVSPPGKTHKLHMMDIFGPLLGYWTDFHRFCTYFQFLTSVIMNCVCNPDVILELLTLQFSTRLCGDLLNCSNDLSEGLEYKCVFYRPERNFGLSPFFFQRAIFLVTVKGTKAILGMGQVLGVGESSAKIWCWSVIKWS